ncbi:hypothetical protein CSUNSWCD_152 [Campylobacter showae CSUNSWCD]|uniref:Uncharacterized protein n=1 Tax=Campylobacter showae CSUNSWCD TaxID=1244083 RepID=M5II28_9BACT|nr:hypothetical protein CSUNSWCD_152 [Campylobacter showae CSUNSWCD]
MGFSANFDRLGYGYVKFRSLKFTVARFCVFGRGLVKFEIYRQICDYSRQIYFLAKFEFTANID